MTLAERLRSPAHEERRAAIAEIATRDKVEPAELDALVACLGDAAKAIQRPAADACRTLAANGVSVVPLLMIALEAPDPRLRFGAAYALARLGPPPPVALPALLDALALDDGDVRWAAAELICRTDPRATVIAGLLPLVRTGNAPQRKMALYCLRDLGASNHDVERAALTAMDDTDGGVRLAAMTTLARLAHDRTQVAEKLMEALNAPDARERRAAAAALGDLGHDSVAVRAALETATRGDDVSLRRAAERSLRRLAPAR
ncbi:MAG: HEAT repeat domain-containing protein [Candidatus Rokuibacteriota bacterium]